MPAAPSSAFAPAPPAGGALRAAGGATGEDDDAALVAHRRGAVAAGGHRPQRVAVDHRARRSTVGGLLGERAVVDDDRAPLGGDDVGQLRSGEAGVQQDDVGPGLARPEQGVDERAVVARQHADGDAGRRRRASRRPAATPSERRHICR